MFAIDCGFSWDVDVLHSQSGAAEAPASESAIEEVLLPDIILEMATS